MPNGIGEFPEGARPPEEGPELIIGLVGAVGAPLGDVAHELEEALDRRGYGTETDDFHLSDRIRESAAELLDETELVEAPADERIRSLQEGGNEIRERLRRNDALALLTCNKVREHRLDRNDEPWEQVPRQAYVFNSLKTPEEVETLRSIYGDGFVLVGVYAPRQDRLEELAEDVAEDRLERDSYSVGQDEEIDALADDILEIDRHQPGEEYGQNVRDTFPKADVFLDASDSDRVEDEVERSVDLLFEGVTPFETPTRDEQCMYVAEAARLRSAAFGRQVGATLSRPEGEVVSIGCNDVPRAGGGLYWSDHDHDNRDFQLGTNISRDKRRETLHEVLARLDAMGALQHEQLGLELEEFDDVGSSELDALMDEFDDTRLSSLIEFYRATHAEMEALFSASRKGLSVEGTTLYSTTFPCHECTRHVIAAGVDRVVYIEPYPKSLGPELHGDAVNVDGAAPALEVWERTDAMDAPKVDFEPFVGVGPRIYDRVFRARRREELASTDGPPESPDPIFAVSHVGWYLDESLEVDTVLERVEEISSE